MDAINRSGGWPFCVSQLKGESHSKRTLGSLVWFPSCRGRIGRSGFSLGKQQMTIGDYTLNQPTVTAHHHPVMQQQSSPSKFTASSSSSSVAAANSSHGKDSTGNMNCVTDDDLNDVVDLADHVEWANLTDKVYAEKDLEIFRTYQPKDSANPLYFIKGWLPCSADTLFNVFLDIRYRKTWDSSAKQLYVLERDKDSEVVYWCVRFPWPLTNRDYVYARRTKFFAKQQCFVIVTKALQHQSAPDCNGVVRVETFHSRVCIRATGTNSCDFHAEYLDDTAFNTPSYLMNVLLGSNVGPLFTELKQACDNYVNFTKSLSDEDATQLTPAQMLRHRWDSSAKSSRAISNANGHGALQRAVTVSHLNGRPSSSICLTDDTQENGVTRRDANSKHSWKRSFRKPKDDSDLANGRYKTAQKSPSMTKIFSKKKQFKTANSNPCIVLPPAELLAISTPIRIPTPPSSHDSGDFSSQDNDVLEDDFTVVFEKQKIGLHLETEVFSNKVVVASCEKNSEAAQSSVSLEPGYILTSINGTNVGLMAFPQVMEHIKTSKRPITLGFAHSDRHNSKQYRRFAHQQQQMKTCVSGYVTRDNVNDFVTALKPCYPQSSKGSLGRDNNRGALLFKASRVVSVKSVQKAVEDQNVQTVPSGFFIRDIDGSQVTHLPISEIIHLLRKNAEVPKLVTFQNVLVASDKARAKNYSPYLSKSKKSPSLSRKLKGVFRWRSRSFDEDPVPGHTARQGSQNGAPKTAPAMNRPQPFIRTGLDSSSAAVLTQMADGDLLASTEECLHDYSKVVVSPKNIRHVWRHVELCRDQERLFSAALLVDRIEECLMRKPQLEELMSTEESSSVKFVFNELRSKRQEIDDLKKKRSGGLRALRDFNSSDEDSDWKFAQTYFGVSTHWKSGEEGTIWIKMEGICEGVDLFNSLAVMKEVDLYSLWTPFCNKSLLLKQVSRVELIVYLSIALPLLQRDCVVHAFGINAVYEYRGVLLVGESINTTRQEELDVHAPLCKGWNSDRVDVRGFRAIIEPLARDKVRMCMVANIDPKCPLPKSLINFATKKVAGVLLYLMMREAEKLEKIQQEQTHHGSNHKANKHQNEHLRRIQEDPTGFYEFLAKGLDEWFDLKRQDLLPALMAIPSDDALCDDSGEFGLDGAHSSTSSSPCGTPRKGTTGLRSRGTFSHSATNKNSQGSADGREINCGSSTTSESAHLQRAWMDAAYEFGVWPFALLFLLSHVTPKRSFVTIAALKLLFTCTCTWFGVPGAMSFKTRASKRLTGELDVLCRKWVLAAFFYDLFNSWLIKLWVHWLQCLTYFWFPASQALCQQRDADALNESEHFWLMASCFVFATGIVAIQIMINI